MPANPAARKGEPSPSVIAQRELAEYRELSRAHEALALDLADRHALLYAKLKRLAPTEPGPLRLAVDRRRTKRITAMDVERTLGEEALEDVLADRKLPIPAALVERILGRDALEEVLENTFALISPILVVTCTKGQSE